MATNIFQRIQESLGEKQKNVTEFLESAPEKKRELCCEDEREVQAHLHVIETSIEKS